MERRDGRQGPAWGPLGDGVHERFELRATNALPLYSRSIPGGCPGLLVASNAGCVPVGANAGRRPFGSVAAVLRSTVYWPSAKRVSDHASPIASVAGIGSSTRTLTPEGIPETVNEKPGAALLQFSNLRKTMQALTSPKPKLALAMIFKFGSITVSCGMRSA